MIPPTWTGLRTAKDCQRYDQADWVVTVHKANYSTFNGGRRTPSNYSEVACTRCGRRWRTNAAYVERLPHI